MPLSNRAPVDASGKLMVTTTTPTAAWPSLGGMTYHPTTGELAVIDAVPNATDPWVGGIRFTNLGSMYVWSAALPAGVEYVGGIPVTDDGRVVVDGSGGAGGIVVGGWPIGSGGGVPVVGLSAQPIFWAPLLTTLVPVIAGNPAFTFTRATTAYVADQDGILRQAIANEARFQGARRVRNLERFTANMDNAAWSVFGGATKGAGTVIFPADPNANVAQVTNVLSTGTASKLISVSMTVSVAAGTGQFRINNTHSAAVAYLSPDLIATTTPQRFAFTQQYTGAAGNGAVNAGIQNGSGGAAATFIVSNIQVEDVTGQTNTAPGDYVSVDVLAAPYHGNAIDSVKYFATTNGNSVAGNIVTEAQGTLIPAATLLGYLCENAATNLCLQSQTFDNGSAWATLNSVITPDFIAAPDGTLTADRFADNTTSGFHRDFQSITLVNATAYTYSLYAKAGTLNWMQLVAAGPSNRWANFNLATGAIGNKDAGTIATIVALPNGWYRCSVSFTSDGTAGAAQIYSSLTDVAAAGPSYVGTGQTMYLWGAQVETGSDPSSYVPTTTVAVSRVGDALSYPGASNIDGALATTYAETYLPTVAAGAQQEIISATLAYFPQYYNAGKALEMYSNGVATTTANTRALGTVNKTSSAWSGTTRSVVMNGGAVATGAYVAQATPASITVAGALSAGQSLRGSIRNVKFFGTRLADSELISMTT